jgi:preprotein translocase subunit SecF
VELDKLRTTLEKIGLRDATVQSFGSSQIGADPPARAPGSERLELSERCFSALQQDDPSVQRPARGLRRLAGRQGAGAKRACGAGLVSVLIVLYLWLRFEWKFGVAAIIANLHES